MENNERENLKLEIVLAGLEVPTYPADTSVQENFDYMLALRHKDEKKAEKYRHKIRNKRATYEDLLRETVEEARAIPKESRKPHLPGFKQLFVDRLDTISSEASSRRFMDDNISSELNWELKAKSRLFGEAKDLIETISADCTAQEFKVAVIAAMKKKDADNDWGWGANWSDSTHHRTMRNIRWEVQKFLEKIE